MELKPTHEQIAALAYEYWAEKAAQNTPEINWRNAEETLIVEMNLDLRRPDDLADSAEATERWWLRPSNE